ncbi:hypothetical protein ACFWN7_09425 [Agromyces sp. NPDC058484]|uniref:hypothetical protein n=1 Tax=Agromyces sp. NPDC058484 TaxID=3346524 RepID=UPI00364B530E
MNTATLSSGSGILADWAVRGGLSLAGWGLQRATRRNDRDRQLGRLDARAAAEAALEERDALIRRAGYLPL